MVLTQPGTPVSFQGMFIHLLFDFWKLQMFQCFPFPENSRTLIFLISGNSGLWHFLILVTHTGDKNPCTKPVYANYILVTCPEYQNFPKSEYAKFFQNILNNITAISQPSIFLEYSTSTDTGDTLGTKGNLPSSYPAGKWWALSKSTHPFAQPKPSR